MIEQFLLPDLGEGLAEAEILRWLVAPGDTVTLNQPLAEVETAKAVVELPSPHEGSVARLFAGEGETVAVGAPLISFEVDGGDEGGDPPAAPETAAGHAAGSAADDEPAPPTLVGYGAAASAKGRPARRARRVVGASAPAEHDPATSSGPPASMTGTGASAPAARPAEHGEQRDRPRSTPPVRAYARRLGVDLAAVATGIGDRVITRGDVDEFSARGGSAAGAANADPALAAPAHGASQRAETRIPVRGVRRFTAEAMVKSAFTAPHVTVFHAVDATATMELIAELRADRAFKDAGIGVLAVTAKAVCLVLQAVPELNARWSGETGEIVQQHYVDLGIAAATERGLVVPVIRDAERLHLGGLAAAIRSLAETARAGKTSPAELSGGTFSITNIGVFGVDGGTPILPPGQSGILALGAVRRQPWEHRGEIALRDVITLSLSFDHRLVDGAEGSRFLKLVAGILEQPGRALTF